MFEPREWSTGDIEYYYLFKRQVELSFVPPSEFDNGLLSYIKLFPKSIFQLESPLLFFDHVKRFRYVKGLQFRVIEWQGEDTYKFFSAHPYKGNVKVFFIHDALEGASEIIKRLKELFDFSFYNVINKSPEIDDRQSFTSPLNLINGIIAQKHKIHQWINSIHSVQGEFSFEYNIPEELKAVNQFNLFKPSHVNFSTISQIFGRDWSTDEVSPTEEEVLETSNKALAKDRGDLSRMRILVEQMEVMDKIEFTSVRRLEIKFLGSQFESLPPIIIVAPFNFPHLGKFLRPFFRRKPGFKLNSLLLQQEQTHSYINTFSAEDDIGEKDKRALGEVIGRKLAFLDGCAYLHASFKNSPVIRLPQQGNSIKRELSFFQPDTINQTKFERPASLLRQFGKKLSTNMLPNEIGDKIFQFNRQIIAITDLPIEWLVVHNRFIALTHDITRIPETPYQAILSSYFTHNTFEFEIDNDIQSKTLVILAASDRDLEGLYNYVLELSHQEGFVAVRCSTVAQVIDAVKKYKPFFLIFDCHGEYDPQSLSSYLKIGNEKLMGKDIIDNNISAPIVFLSACHTSPTYGYINSLSQYFISSGCLAITATYLPISQVNAGILYIRLLKNLTQAAKDPIYENWLQYVCQIIRTSFVTEVYTSVMNKLNRKSGTLAEQFQNDFEPAMVKATAMLTEYSTRSSVIEFLQTEIGKVSPHVNVDIKNLAPEFLFYTNIGRGDLIKFRSWKKKYYELNGLDVG